MRILSQVEALLGNTSVIFRRDSGIETVVNRAGNPGEPAYSASACI